VNIVEPLNKTEVNLDQAVFFLHADELQAAPHQLAWQLNTKILRDHPDTGVVLEVETPVNWLTDQSACFDCPVEIIVLDGTLTMADLEIETGDFLQIPKGGHIHPSSSDGARFLMFFDKGNPGIFYKGKSQISAERSDSLPREEPDTEKWLFVKEEDSPWVSGTALAEAGVDDVPLKIKHYKQDPDTGARTYLVAVNTGVSIPWEVHDIAEEAYIVEGDYVLAECLPTGSQIGHYRQGGYFYRPAGIAHNGPASGTNSGVIMLIRTPGPLKVELVDGCRFDV